MKGSFHSNISQTLLDHLYLLLHLHPTQVSEVTINPNKQANPQVINLGDTVTYTITFQNVGNINATDVIITDPTPSGTTFIPNSVTINGVTQPGTNPNNGVNVGTVTPGQIVTLTYQVTVTELPPDGIIKNTATVTYTFQPNPSEPLLLLQILLQLLK